MPEVVQLVETTPSVIETTTGLPTTIITTPAATVESLQAQIDKMAAALKDANRDDAKRRKRIDELEAAEKVRAEAAMTETQKAQARLAELQPQAEKAQAYEAVIAELLEGRLKVLIPEARKAIEDLPGDTLARLQWLTRNEALFTRQSAPRLDGGSGGGDRDKDRPITLTEDQLRVAKAMNVNPEAYAKRLKELAARQAGV